MSALATKRAAAQAGPVLFAAAVTLLSIFTLLPGRRAPAAPNPSEGAPVRFVPVPPPPTPQVPLPEFVTPSLPAAAAALPSPPLPSPAAASIALPALAPVAAPSQRLAEVAGLGSELFVREEAVEQRPTLLNRVDVQMPRLAQERRLSGKVILRLQVDATGRVLGAKIASAQPPGVFESAAMAAARQMQFSPARIGGRPVPVTFSYAVDFVPR